MEEKHSTRLGSLIFIGVVLEIVKCIFVYPKMQHVLYSRRYLIRFYWLDCQFMVRLHHSGSHCRRTALPAVPVYS